MSGKINVYEEIVAEWKRLIEVGALRHGDKLPSVRSYAVERKVNPNTVAKAYATLETEGYIRVMPKKGAYVAYDNGAKQSHVAEIEKQIALLRGAGIEKTELLAAIERVYEEKER